MDVGTEDESADDEVVEELNVFLSKSLNDHLYLLQYPVLNSKRRYGATGREFANIKAQNNKIEMDVTLDISSPNYDQSKGEQIALNVDGNAGTSQTPTVFETNVMDKQTLYSTSVPPRGKRYVCGVVHNSSLHLTPVSHIMQLRPSFKYMDRAERRVLQAAKAKATAEADSSQDEAEEAKAVTLRIKGAETEAVRLARERSYTAYEKRLADEKWTRMKVHHKMDPYAERERRRLICQKMRESEEDNMGQGVNILSEMVQTPSQYLKKLAPIYAEHAVDNTVLPNNVLSLSSLKNENTGEQLKLLMKNAKIMHFSHLLSILPNSPDENAVVRSLQSYAVLVKGCWVVKSEVLFLPNMQSPLSGTSSETLCRSRDYMLYMFTRKNYLVRKEITSTVKVPGEEIKAILDDIAVMHTGHGWKLRLEPDYDFMKKFPDVCERQAMLWKAQAAKLAKQMNLNDLSAEVEDLTIKQEAITPTRRKKTLSSSEQISTTKKCTKPSKRRRKLSGQKHTLAKNTANCSPIQVKNEPMSPPATMNLSPLSLMQPSRTTIKTDSAIEALSIEIESSTGIPPMNSTRPQPFVTDISDIPLNSTQNLSSEINIAGVTTTVQSVANEMINISSPNHNQGIQYFVPQMSIGSSKVAMGDATDLGVNGEPITTAKSSKC